MDIGDPVAALSKKLHVPRQKIEEIYSAQLERLSAEARIDSFLTILAIRNARAILRATASSEVPDSIDRLDSGDG